jgi:hypothetical protein
MVLMQNILALRRIGVLDQEKTLLLYVYRRVRCQNGLSSMAYGVGGQSVSASWGVVYGLSPLFPNLLGEWPAVFYKQADVHLAQL